MTLDKVLEIANECVYNDNIPVEGLTLKYILDKKTHEKLDKELFYKTNNNNPNFIHNEVIELTIAGVTFIFEQK
tara:strand:- start:4 stop:225 length:222 start_codon:yes stop_codon:yes gene_type:complete